MHFLTLFKAGMIWCGMLLSLYSYGQTDGTWIPLGAMPMQYNGSFAGEAGAPRISSSFSFHERENSYLDFHQAYAIYTSFDHFFSSIGTGIGITTGYERSNGFFIDNHKIRFLSIAIAPKFSIKGKYTVSPSLDFTHSSGNDFFTDFHYYLGDYKSLSTRAGLLFNSSKYYVSYSVYLLNQLKTIDQKSPWNREGFKSYLQFGYSFQRSIDSKFSFTPQFAFRISEKGIPEENIVGWQNINLSFRYTKYIAGINPLGLQLGIQNEKLRLLLSSEFGLISSFRPYSGNLSFRYIFKNSENGGIRSVF